MAPKALVVVSRDLNSFSGEAFKVKCFIKSLSELGYKVDLLTTVDVQVASLPLNKIIYQKVEILKALKNFCFHFPTSMQRCVYSSYKFDCFDDYDLVVFSLIRTVPHVPIRTKTLVDMADLLSINFARLASKESFVRRILRIFEAKLLRFDEVKVGKHYNSTFVSRVEVRKAKMLGIKSFLLRQAAPVSMLNEVEVSRLTTQNKRILFVGPDAYLPNHEALRILNDRVAKLLPQDWKIAWAGTPSGKNDYENITSLGRVDDLPREITSSYINVAPIFTSTGVQTKLLDLLYLGAFTVAPRKIIYQIENTQVSNSLKNLIATPNDISSFVDVLVKTVYKLEKNTLDNQFVLNDSYSLNKFIEKLKNILNEK